MYFCNQIILNNNYQLDILINSGVFFFYLKKMFTIEFRVVVGSAPHIFKTIRGISEFFYFQVHVMKLEVFHEIGFTTLQIFFKGNVLNCLVVYILSNDILSKPFLFVIFFIQQHDGRDIYSSLFL